MDWFHLTQDRNQWWAVVNTIINLRDPLKAGNFLTVWMTVSFSRRTLLHEMSLMWLSWMCVTLPQLLFTFYKN